MMEAHGYTTEAATMTMAASPSHAPSITVPSMRRPPAVSRATWRLIYGKASQT